SEEHTSELQSLTNFVCRLLLGKKKVENWIDVFRHIHHYTQKGAWTIYFEEVQWLSDYKSDFVSELKYAWDNYFWHKLNTVLVLCCSATSFMINQVLRSKDLYNRSQYEMQLREFSLKEVQQFFKKHSLRDVMDAYFFLGGSPQHLYPFFPNSSLFL